MEIHIFPMNKGYWNLGTPPNSYSQVSLYCRGGIFSYNFGLHRSFEIVISWLLVVIIHHITKKSSILHVNTNIFCFISQSKRRAFLQAIIFHMFRHPPRSYTQFSRGNFQKRFELKILPMNPLLLHKVDHVKNQPFKEEPISLNSDCQPF